LRAETFREIVKQIPDDVSVATYTNLLPYLSHREYIKMIGYEDFYVDIVIIDRFDKLGFSSDQQFQQYFDSRINSGLYKMTIIDDRYIVLQKF